MKEWKYFNIQIPVFKYIWYFLEGTLPSFLLLHWRPGTISSYSQRSLRVWRKEWHGAPTLCQEQCPRPFTHVIGASPHNMALKKELWFQWTGEEKIQKVTCNIKPGATAHTRVWMKLRPRSFPQTRLTYENEHRHSPSHCPLFIFLMKHRHWMWDPLRCGCWLTLKVVTSTSPPAFRLSYEYSGNLKSS